MGAAESFYSIEAINKFLGLSPLYSFCQDLSAFHRAILLMLFPNFLMEKLNIHLNGVECVRRPKIS